jgi:hypothetical protein
MAEQATAARETACRLEPGSSLTTGRATTSRMANRPIESITATNITQRVISSAGVTAVADTRGTLNCGAGPGLGPTANVKAPWTG